MNILVIDGGHLEAEFRAKFGPGHEYDFFSTDVDPIKGDWLGMSQKLATVLNSTDVTFDFTGAIRNFLRPERRQSVIFQEASGAFAGFADGLPASNMFGFCGLPTLLNRPLLEVSLYDEADREKLAATCAALGTDYRVVADRVGLVTPRVICQIINEACYTVQEGTATMQAVDLSMKLGTNYPHGPFAWANAIGVARVYAVLEALWQDTHDERYKVCPLLKRQALRGEAFAV